MKLITYNTLVMNEGGINLQAGMNFGIRGSYSIVLMSTLRNAPYSDEMLENGVIKYEGHDQYRIEKELKKIVDQPIKNKTGTLTQNGKFLLAAEKFKDGKRDPAKIKVYRKMRIGMWTDMDFYDLIDAFIEHDGKRNVFKFLLRPNFDNFKPEESDNIDIVHNRYIPGDVMQDVFIRDEGKCVVCGAKDNLHFDHKIPLSKGGSSKDPKNIQILCARHNLSKGNKLVY